MNASKLGWVVFGLAVGAAAAWSFRPASEEKAPPAIVTPVEQVAKETPAPYRAPPKKVRVAAKANAEVELVVMKLPAPDVSACGKHALVPTEVIAHVSGKGGKTSPRVNVSAMPESPELSDCVRERVTAADLKAVDGVQTFRYSFAP